MKSDRRWAGPPRAQQLVNDLQLSKEYLKEKTVDGVA